MQLHLASSVPFANGGPSGDDDLLDALDLALDEASDGAVLRMTLRNSGDVPLSIRRVGIVVPLLTDGPVRMFSNGYQSWTGSAVVTLGVDTDPSLAPDSIDGFRPVHHADPRRVRQDELRSEMVTLLADATDDIACLGALGGERHDTTFRLRFVDGEPEAGAELVIEAFLGGAVMGPGESRVLHDVMVDTGSSGEHGRLLDRWATSCGRTARARVDAPYQVGWCSWYHYFEHITEATLDANLALAHEWPFDVFQLDDGFQSAIGDWLTTDDTFDDLADIAVRIAAAGRRPGLWLAPFVAHPDSVVAREHPEWFARTPDGAGPLPGWLNEAWGGVVDVLDTTHPEVLAHLESLAATLVAMGFTYLKLDFTMAPSFEGMYHDPSKTPAERVRAGYDAIRRGAGDDTFILGCGAPLGACVGVVDGMRIGCDVAPSWTHDWAFPSGYLETVPATVNSYQATLARSFMHRRLWLNDPDCLMLRTDETEMTPDAVRAWALTVAASGGMALVSDDLSLLGAESRALLDEVIELGRRVDAEAIAGSAPVCVDLMDRRVPTTLSSSVVTLVVDPEAAQVVSIDR